MKQYTQQVSVCIVALLCICHSGVSRGQSESLIALPREGKSLVTPLDASRVGEETAALVVCPQAWQGYLRPWLEHRRKQGFQMTVIGPELTAEALQGRIRELALANPGQLKYLVLFGDVLALAKQNGKVVSEPTEAQKSLAIPTFYVESTAMVRFGSEPHIASDNPYADLDNDGAPELAVGRVPVDNAEELKNWIQRVIQYENQQDFSEWRRRVHVVAGVGGFGMLIDSAVEMTAKQFLGQGIPQGYSLTLTQASPSSPYCPPPELFAQTTLERFNEGGLFWIYLGHGNIRHLDFIRGDNQWHCIMDEQCMQQVKPGRRSPIALFLACYTGAFDATEDSLAECLVRKNDGPVAVLAGSRMTGPYGMSVLGSEMLEVCFEDRCETLGDIVRQAKCRSLASTEVKPEKLSDGQVNSKRKWIDQLASALSPTNHDLARERFEHAQMMNLIGDPMLRIAHPEEIDLECESTIEAGSTLIVNGSTPLAGTLTLDVVYRRDRVPEAAKGKLLQEKQKNSAASEVPAQQSSADRKEIYDLANQSVVVHRVITVQPGKFTAELEIPADVKGSCSLRAFLQGEQAWGLGGADLTVRSKKNLSPR